MKERKNNFKKAFLLVLPAIFLILAIIGANTVKSKNKAYYSGDAINYKGKVIIGSTNMGDAEIFKLQGDRLARVATINSSAKINKGSGFFSIVFNEENGRLFAYIIDGRFIYKYDVTETEQPLLVAKEKDNSWDWFVSLGKSGNRIITIGSKGVKVWNNSLQVVDSFKIESKHFNNIQLSENGKNLFRIENGALEIWDTASRQVIAEADLDLKEERNYRNISIGNREVYLIDDKNINKFDYSGKLLKEYEHGSGFGYDVVAGSGGTYFYVSNGKNILKVDKDLKPVLSSSAFGLGGSGSWLMKIKAVGSGDQERIVAFNNSNILLLDNNLRKISSIAAQTAEEKSQESLFLAVDKNRAPANSLVSLRGGGFGLSEPLVIEFAGQKTEIKADENGRFVKIITIPSVLPIKTDIKVTGQNSKLHYNLGFEIE